MIGITTILLVLFHHVNNSFGTRLPLEVFEIPQSTQVYTSSPSSSTSSNYMKLKSVYNHHPDRRRSRQMLETIQPQGTRILYQVGDSEEDLPICAPNAVCSKIDLYETPWIERQCRCPETSSLKPASLTIIHHKNYQEDEHPFHDYYETEKATQHKRLLDIEDTNKRIETPHLRKLMQKLGAVYEDDILLDDNDFVESPEVNRAYHNHKSEFSSGIHRNYPKSNKNNNHEGGRLRHSSHRKDIPYIGGCPSSLGVEDGHTIADKTRHYKLCNPIHRLPLCRYFRDYTWTLSTSPEMNVTEQIVHCRCPKNSVTYLTKREPLTTGRAGYTYLFACSPQSRLRCQRKEPCKLFTVRKRQEFLDEVNTNPLCQCPKGHRCPKHHTDPGVIAGKSFVEDNIQTYSGYCMAND